MKAVDVFAIVGVFTFLATIFTTAEASESSKIARAAYNFHPIQTTQEWLTKAYNDLSDELEKLQTQLSNIAKELQEEIREVIECEHNVINGAITVAETFLNDAKQCIQKYVPIFDWVLKVKDLGKTFMRLIEELFDGIPNCWKDARPGVSLFDRASETLQCMTDVVSGLTERFFDLRKKGNAVIEDSDPLSTPEISQANICLLDAAKPLFKHSKNVSVETYNCLKKFSIPDLV